MYVRWQSYKKVHEQKVVHWSAVLVEAVRVDGKPRQRHIAYLGGLEVQDPEAPGYQHPDNKSRRNANQCMFWKRALETLEFLGNRVSPNDHKKIVAAVVKRIPMPTEAEKERSRRELPFWDW
jgi:hypothetical protein